MLSEDQIASIMPNLPSSKRADYLPHLQRAMDEFDINTPLRMAASIRSCSRFSPGANTSTPSAATPACASRARRISTGRWS